MACLGDALRAPVGVAAGGWQWSVTVWQSAGCWAGTSVQVGTHDQIPFASLRLVMCY